MLLTTFLIKKTTFYLLDFKGDIVKKSEKMCFFSKEMGEFVCKTKNNSTFALPQRQLRLCLAYGVSSTE
jgi:hypothetical protein